MQLKAMKRTPSSTALIVLMKIKATVTNTIVNDAHTLPTCLSCTIWSCNSLYKTSRRITNSKLLQQNCFNNCREPAASCGPLNKVGLGTLISIPPLLHPSKPNLSISSSSISLCEAEIFLGVFQDPGLLYVSFNAYPAI